ncbi:shikimate dehydrogenase [Mesobacillus persicus]|uniref:Shikimate dehydrogenase (NADP(+)) n=1 Tax=Mesobacillus persicus TaxID=930146 RepID=A0A1H7XAW9_9BACI|nr:shikimate dehydrogenase [Mesobacillus persicus]SEM30764.1 shikimate dehydrogenase [Mesobacillus persicus]
MKKLFGVIGDPIAHSMSPVMHNDLFNHYGIDAAYVPLHVRKSNLEDAIKGFKAIGIDGFNVTIPHKTEIMNFLDEIDPLAEAIGAVNTVVNKEGTLIGYNTDGRGFVRGLTEELSSLPDKKVMLIGAGGAARAIYFSMAEAGVQKMDICNRTTEKADLLKKACPFPVNTSIFDIEGASKCIEDYDLLIQTTSIGMSPNVDERPLEFNQLKIGCFASDIIYNPLETQFLKEAKSLGANIQNGIEMFVYQGALAFELWTGIFPDTKRMKKNVLNQLGGSTC